MVWTLILLITAGCLLALMAGAGAPWSWLPPATIGAVLLYRLLAALRRR